MEQILNWTAKQLLLVVTGLALVTCNAQAALIIGDIQIIGYRSDADDAISFVTWANIAAGESLFFTDSGFFSDGTLRDSEEIMSWTAGAGGLAAGSVVVISSATISTPSTGTTTGRLNGMSSDGDQVFVGLAAFPNTNNTTSPGSPYAPANLLYGFDFNGTAGWDATAADPNTSALPNALNVSFGNMSVAHVDNGQYTGPREGLTIEQFKMAVASSANWTFDNNGANITLSTAGFVAVPEPSSIALVGLVLMGTTWIRRRR